MAGLALVALLPGCSQAPLASSCAPTGESNVAVVIQFDPANHNATPSLEWAAVTLYDQRAVVGNSVRADATGCALLKIPKPGEYSVEAGDSGPGGCVWWAGNQDFTFNGAPLALHLTLYRREGCPSV